MPVKEVSSVLPGIEVRCPNKTMKSYDGQKKLKTCSSLLAVVDQPAGSCAFTIAIKCYKCRQMVTHTIQS